MTLSHRNQSIDLLCKLIDWFLYEKAIGRERVKPSYNWVKYLDLSCNRDVVG